MQYDNPAARLKVILEAGLQADKKKQCLLVWRELLDADANSTDDLFARLGKVMELPLQTVQALEVHFPHQVAPSTLWRAPIEAGFMNQQLGATWETFIQHINSYCVPQLALLADLLHSKIGALSAEEEKISDLIQHLNALLTDVEKSQLSDALKQYVVSELGELIRTLREYKLTGGSPAIRQAEAMVVHTHIDKDYLHFLKSHELGKRVLENLKLPYLQSTLRSRSWLQLHLRCCPSEVESFELKGLVMNWKRYTSYGYQAD